MISQAIAFLAVLQGIISFQCKSRRTILLWMAGSAYTVSAHFFVLGETTPALFYAIMASRSLLAAHTTDRRMLLITQSLFVVAFLFGAPTPLNYLALATALLATHGCFQKRHERMRPMLMMAQLLWVVHHLLFGTPVAALSEGAYLASNGIGYWRHVLRPGIPEDDLASRAVETTTGATPKPGPPI